MRRRLLRLGQSWWLRVAISAALLAWLIHKIDSAHVARLYRELQWQLVAWAALFHFLNRLLTTWKWRTLLRAKGFTYSYGYLLRVVWVSNFFGHFLPAAIGGDNVRMFAMARSTARAPEAVSTVLMERLTGVVSLGALAFVGASWSYERWGRSEVIAVLLVPFTVLLMLLVLLWTPLGRRLLSGLLLRLRRVPGYHFLRHVYEAVQSYRHQPRPVLMSLGISCLIQLNRVSAIYCLTRALGGVLLPGDALALVPTALFVSMLPISISGLGVQEGAFVFLLSLGGVNASLAFGVSMLSRLVQLVSNAPGAILFLCQGLGRPSSAVHAQDRVVAGART